MTKRKVLATLKEFQQLPDSRRQRFFDAFEEKMLYRTTKTENPETTPQIVQRVLERYQARR